MDNIILIGMPGVGKSTVGVVLAKILGFHFLDSDLLIQEKEGKLLHELISEHGNEGFLNIEEKVNMEIHTTNTVIATGGSVIYGAKAMEHLSNTGMICYLEISYKELQHRLGDLTKRGVTLQKKQSLLDLYHERIPYYEKYANMTISCDHRQIRHIAEEIATFYRNTES